MTVLFFILCIRKPKPVKNNIDNGILEKLFARSTDSGILSELKKSRGVGIDISQKALMIARKNA